MFAITLGQKKGYRYGSPFLCLFSLLEQGTWANV